MTSFGPLNHPGVVFDAVQQHLEAWLTTYIAEVERQTDRDPRALPVVKGKWHTAAEIDQWFDHPPPAGAIAIPGTLDEPQKLGAVYRAVWDVRVGVLVSVSGRADAENVAALYGAAVRGALIQHPALADGVHVEAWLGEDLTPIPREKTRTLGMTINSFRVRTDGVLNRQGGPATPPDDPYAVPGPAPTVSETEVTVDHLEPE